MALPNAGKLQLVWWWSPRDWNFSFRRFDPEKTDWGYIYEWCVGVGPLEIRRWSRLDAPREEKE